MQYVKRIFGVDLATRCLAYKTDIPTIVTDCVREIELRGLNIEGIYRISGSHDIIEDLKIKYDDNAATVDISANAVEDISAIAGLLKVIGFVFYY